MAAISRPPIEAAGAGDRGRAPKRAHRRPIPTGPASVGTRAHGALRRKLPPHPPGAPGVGEPRADCPAPPPRLHRRSAHSELRRVPEPKVMKWAAEPMTSARATSLRRQFPRLERIAAQQDLPGCFREDVLFHRMIRDVAGGPHAARALEIIPGSLFASGLIGAAIDLRAEARKHNRLLEALCARAWQIAPCPPARGPPCTTRPLPRSDSLHGRRALRPDRRSPPQPFRRG
jgi:hypothetical protein